MKNKKITQYIFPIAFLICLTPWVGSGTALAFGLCLALIFENPYTDLMKRYTHVFLSVAVAGLGAGMNLEVISNVGFQGIGYTLTGIITSFIVGGILGRLINTEKDTSLLLTVGTAICGGSAIAAVAPVIRAKHHEVSVALGTVFILNAVALFIFPWIGHSLNLTESQFGLWCALAIHDTSSVVGATLQFGAKALEVGTTIKLARALWIIPVAMTIGFIRSRGPQKEVGQKTKKPLFILWFLIAAALVTWIPSLQPAGHAVETVAKKIMVITLFMIGAGLSRTTIKSVGIRPFAQGIALWLFMGSLSLSAVYFQWIQ